MLFESSLGVIFVVIVITVSAVKVICGEETQAEMVWPELAMVLREKVVRDGPNHGWQGARRNVLGNAGEELGMKHRSFAMGLNRELNFKMNRSFTKPL